MLLLFFRSAELVIVNFFLFFFFFLNFQRLEVMPGFETSILRYEAGNLLGIDIIHKILRIDTFLDCLYNLYDSVEQTDRAAFHAVAMKQFVGTIVMTR